MSTAVLQLEESVKKLSHKEFSEFQRWFAEYEAAQKTREKEAANEKSVTTKQQEWQDFVQRTSGMFADFPLERPPQKEWTKREEW
jgi:hypothetical protein